MTMSNNPALARLLLATLELVEAQRALERAQKRFDAAFADAEATAVFDRAHNVRQEGRS